AVSVVLAFSWPAVITSLDQRRWSRAGMALVALLLCGTYSVTAALGSAMGGRTSAAIEAKDAGDRKARTQAAYDAARAELDQLAAAKPGAELQTLIESARADLAKLAPNRPIAEIEALAKRGCRVGVALTGQIKTSCPKYDAELARAWERQRLTGRITELTIDIGRAEQRQIERRERVNAAMDAAAVELGQSGPA